MVAYLTKSDASEGFTQIINFLNRSYIKYALTVNPNIYVSCIKQSLTTVAIKQVNDVTRLQALVNKKKVVITEARIRDALRLDYAEGVDCLPMKRFLLNWLAWVMRSHQQSLHSIRLSSQASGSRKFNFSKYIFESLMRNVDSNSKSACTLALELMLPWILKKNTKCLMLLRTGRNIRANGPTSLGFDMSKVECYNCHMRGYFAREFRSPKDSKRNGAVEPQRRSVPVETSTSNALVSQCDGVGSYDWSFQAEEEPANYALMAFSYSSSSSDNEVPSCSKSCLESVEARLLVYKQNESVFEENIKLLNIEVHLRDNALVALRQKLEKVEQERDDLKLKFQPSDGCHVVPPPYTRTFMPPKPNLVFNIAPTAVKTDHPAFTIQLSPTKPAQDLSYTNRPTTPIIEDWVSNSEDESETKAPQIVPSFVQSTEQVKSPKHSV
nr:hypothetical protein [Tanacetum cinerariifolium]